MRISKLFGWQGPTEGPHDYAHTGKTRKELDAELRDTAADHRKRTLNRNDTEDQRERAKHLRETRGRLN